MCVAVSSVARRSLRELISTSLWAKMWTTYVEALKEWINNHVYCTYYLKSCVCILFVYEYLPIPTSPLSNVESLLAFWCSSVSHCTTLPASQSRMRHLARKVLYMQGMRNCSFSTGDIPYKNGYCICSITNCIHLECHVHTVL